MWKDEGRNGWRVDSGWRGKNWRRRGERTNKRVEGNYESGPIHGMAGTGIGTRAVLYLCRAHTAFLLTTSISCFSAFTTCRDREGTAG